MTYFYVRIQFVGLATDDDDGNNNDTKAKKFLVSLLAFILPFDLLNWKEEEKKNAEKCTKRYSHRRERDGMSVAMMQPDQRENNVGCAEKRKRERESDTTNKCKTKIEQLK